MTPEQKALEEASADLGANPWTTFVLVTLPQIRAGIVTGSIFAFISRVCGRAGHPGAPARLRRPEGRPGLGR
nr:hypothetical protein [Cupriavidus sp. TA19]